MEIEYGIGTKRVSSTKQGLAGDSPEQQQEQIMRKVEQVSAIKGKKIVIKKWFQFIESASGDLDMQPINEVIEYCKNPKNKVKYLFLKSIDRFTRGGSIIYGLLKMQLVKYGVQIIDVYGVIGDTQINTLGHLGVEYEWSKYNPSWITELLEAERSKGEVRDILSRMIGAEIHYVRLGYRVREAPMGYINKKIDSPHGKRVVLEAHPIEAKWFTKMFELRIAGNIKDEKIVEEVNAMGFKTRQRNLHNPLDKTKVIGHRGNKPLTLEKLHAYLSRPIYAGVNTEKWVEGKLIKGKFNGLVTIDQFNKANRGKVTIIEKGDEVIIYKGKPPKWQLTKNRQNPMFPYKNYMTCPLCHKPLLGSSSRGKMGVRYPAYHCNRGHYYRVTKKVLEDAVKEFCSHLEFADEFKKRFKSIILEEWEKRERSLSNDTIDLHKVAADYEVEIQNIKDKIKQVSSPNVIKMLEDDIDALQQKKVGSIAALNKKEDEQMKLETVINYVQYYMEHLEELLLGGSDPMQNAAMFGLAFEVAPTYEEIKNGTPKLAPIFKLNDAYVASKNQTVSHQGIEP